MSRRLFLERRTYRQNRLQDAARLLPVLGLLLFFAPIFIRQETDPGVTISASLVYYFGVWLLLIVVTALISRGLRPVTGLSPTQQARPDRAHPVSAGREDLTPRRNARTPASSVALVDPHAPEPDAAADTDADAAVRPAQNASPHTAQHPEKGSAGC